MRRLFNICLYALFGTIMFSTKLIMEVLPNVHLVSMLIIVCTVVFGWKAIFPIYVYVFLTGVYAGFAPWWIPYFYIWLFPYLLTLAVPKKLPYKFAFFVYIIICGLHGFLYGTLYAPAQALMFGLDFKGMIAWIVAGIPFDMIHGISNCIVATLVLPICIPLKKVYKQIEAKIS